MCTLDACSSCLSMLRTVLFPLCTMLCHPMVSLHLGTVNALSDARRQRLEAGQDFSAANPCITPCIAAHPAQLGTPRHTYTYGCSWHQHLKPPAVALFCKYITGDHVSWACRCTSTGGC